MIVRVLCGLGLICLASAQPVGSGVISGVVVQSNNEPVRKAIVTLTLNVNPVCWATMMTDGEGRFKFESLPAGAYSLRAERRNLGEAVYDEGRFLNLQDAESAGNVRLQLIRFAAISGRVLNANGEPLEYATVTALRADYPSAKPANPAGQTNSGTSGDFRISKLTPGLYYLRVTHPSSPSLQYYGGAKDWRRSTPIRVRSGQELEGFDFRVSKSPVATLRGRVTGVPDGARLSSPWGSSSLLVTLETSGELTEESSQGTGVRPPKYEFEFWNKPLGPYWITVELEHHGKKLWAGQAIELSENISDLVLPLSTAFDMEGSVKVVGAEPVKGKVEISLEPPYRGLERKTARSTTVARDGRFRFEQLTPGSWRLAVSTSNPNAFVNSISIGDRQVLNDQLDLTSPLDAPLIVVLSTNGGRVIGQAEGEAIGRTPVAIWLVPLGPEKELQRLYRVTTAAPDGKFEISAIRPGSYRLIGVEKMGDLDLHDPGLTELLTKFGSRIEVRSGDRLHMKLDVVTSAQLREALQ